MTHRVLILKFVILTVKYVFTDFSMKAHTKLLSLWGHLTEWLRWWTRNPLGNSRVGSNPAVVAALLNFRFFLYR